jgi:radical SAM protein with 4Fe4S-binding SPASM domain
MAKGPRIIFWESTKRCNLKCRYCRVLKDTPADELNTDEAMRLISDIKSSFPEALLVISGGEPLIREDIFDILAHASRIGLKTSLATNGTLLGPDEAEKLKGCGVRRVSISIDSIDKAAHDKSRGVEGSYKRALYAASILREKEIPLQVNFTITKSNKDKIVPIAELSSILGAAALHYFILVAVGCGRELREEDMIDSADMDKVLRTIERVSNDASMEVRPTCAPQYIRYTKDRQYVGCLAGGRVLFISSQGDLYPCGYLPVKAGSIKEEDIGDIWRDSEVFGILREGKLRDNCSACTLVNRCRGCRARAYSSTGDYMAGDPTCLRHDGTKKVDNTDRRLLLALQEGMPIVAKPYEALARKVGISEEETISRLKAHKESGLVKRVDLRLDLKKIGLSRTLVACRVPDNDIPRAREVISSCSNVTHNYLRRDSLNMWFTLNAPSIQKLTDLLVDLKHKLGAEEMLSFKTKKTFKLRFRFNVK